MVVRMRVGIREAKWRRYQNENRRPSGRQSNRDMPRGSSEDGGGHWRRNYGGFGYNSGRRCVSGSRLAAVEAGTDVGSIAVYNL